MRFLPIGIAFVLYLSLPVSGAVRGKEVKYMGGTLNGIADNTEGKLETSREFAIVFIAKKSQAAIPYKKITSLQYGEQIGRRVAAALLTKKRKHYITISYSDDAGKKQSAVFELAKGVVYSVVTSLETGSGKKLEFDSKEAREQYEKEAK